MRTFILTAAAALAIAASASAAPPLKRAVWITASNAWKAQATAHGATAACTPWNASGVLGMACDFGARGRVTVGWMREPCVYGVTVYYPKPRFPLYEHSTLNYCQRGWAKNLPAPWKTA